MEPSQGGRDAKEGTQRGPDSLRVEAGRERGQGARGLPKARGQRADLLPVESCLWGAWGLRVAETEAASRREQPVEAPSGRPEPG